MTDRAGKDNPTGIVAYFKAIKEIFELQSKVLTGALPHYGERGRNDEQRLSKLLEQVLPRRYSLGTGFIISSHPDLAPSPQVDIIIHDEVHNSPLFRELAANVFPIEAVYATVEVKSDLSLEKLREAAEAVVIIRRMAKKDKYYAHYVSVDAAERRADILPQVMEVQLRSTLPPRAYIVGYDADAETPDSFVSRLTKLSSEFPEMFLHGIYAVRQNWFFCQDYGQRTFTTFKENGLLAFISKLIPDLQSFDMKPMAISRYIENDLLRATATVQEGEKNPG